MFTPTPSDSTSRGTSAPFSAKLENRAQVKAHQTRARRAMAPAMPCRPPENLVAEFRIIIIIARVPPARSVQLQLVSAGQTGKLFVRFRLIPKRDGGDVVLQLQVASAGLPAERLNRHLQILLEANRVRDVPAIQAEARLRIAVAIGPDDLGEAGVGR